MLGFFFFFNAAYICKYAFVIFGTAVNSPHFALCNAVIRSLDRRHPWLLTLLLTLNANTLARGFHLRRASSFFSPPFPLTLVFSFFFPHLQSGGVDASSASWEPRQFARNDPGRLFTGRFPQVKGGRMCSFSSFPRPVLDVFICRQPHSTVYYGNLLLPPAPPPALPSLSSTSSPPTLRTVLLSRGCRCTQFNFAVPLRREGRKRAGEGMEGGGGGRYVGIRDEHKSRGGGGVLQKEDDR